MTGRGAMSNSSATKSEPKTSAQPETAAPTSQAALLDDLEARHDEVLRRLEDLTRRLDAVLAEFTAPTRGQQPAAASDPLPASGVPTPPSRRRAS